MIAIEKAALTDVKEIKFVLTEAIFDAFEESLSQAAVRSIIAIWHDDLLLAHQIENSEFYMGVAREKDSMIVGVITVKLSDAGVLLINRLHVIPEFQRQGIGNRLLQKGVSFYPDAVSIRTEVELASKKGHSFFLKRGFKEVEKKEKKIEKESVVTVIMEKRF